MNDALLEILLRQEESESLDFKRDQYLYVGATNEEKSELLKDILAFANSWKRDDAYILIGVDEVRGGRSNPVGVVQHLNDADLQQFVNSKTNRPLRFSYLAYEVNGQPIGIIHIPVQQRPFYLKNDYGGAKPKLLKGVVYVRRGSSTALADPDEIAQMGAAQVAAQPRAALRFSIADRMDDGQWGEAVRLRSVVLTMPPTNQIPKFGNVVEALTGVSSLRSAKPNYFRNYARFLERSSLLREIGFVIENTGPALVTGINATIIIPKVDGLMVIDESDYPKVPERYTDYILSAMNLPASPPMPERYITLVEEYPDRWEIDVTLGDIQPGARRWSQELYIGSTKPYNSEVEAVIYADNLPEPMRVPLAITIDTDERNVTVDELLQIEAADQAERQRRFEEEYKDLLEDE